MKADVCGVAEQVQDELCAALSVSDGSGRSLVCVCVWGKLNK